MIKKLLEKYDIKKFDNITIHISNNEFNFAYTKLSKPIPGKRYFGGLQCNFESDTIEYKLLENELCNIAETLLN